MIGRIGTGNGAVQESSKSDSPAKIRDAAQQFESLLVAQLLKSAHGESGWLGSGDDQAGAIGVGMAEQEFARMLTAAGGLGISKTIASGLERASTHTRQAGAERTNGQT